MPKKKLDQLIVKLGLTREFIYLHMPKTAGMAIKSAIEKCGDLNRFSCKPHSCSFQSLTLLEKRMHTFTSVRNPVTWYASLYNYKMHHVNDSNEKDYSSMVSNSLVEFIDDVVYGSNGIEGYMKWNKPRKFKQHIEEMLTAYYASGANEKIGFCTLNFLYYTSASWKDILKEKCIHSTLIDKYHQCVDITSVLKMEQLGLDFAKMVEGRGVNVNLNEKVNKMDGNPYLPNISQDVLSHIYQKDHSLFKLFEYPMP